MARASGVFIGVFHDAPTVDVDDERAGVRASQEIKADDVLVKGCGDSATNADFVLGEIDARSPFAAVGIPIDDAIDVRCLPGLCVKVIADSVNFDVGSVLRLIEAFVYKVTGLTNEADMWVKSGTLVLDLSKESANTAAFVVYIHIYVVEVL